METTEPLAPAELLTVICPYLLAADGRWRSAHPSRDHRCTGAVPPQPLAILTQKRLCLTAEHAGCETYLAAVARRRADLESAHISPERLASSRFGSLRRSEPLVVDRPTTRVLSRDATGRAASRTVVAALGVAVAIVIVLSGVALLRPPQRPATGAVAATPSPTAIVPGETRSPPSQRATSPPTPSPTATTTGPPTAAPVSPTPAPPRARRYRVRRGDTLFEVSRRFGVSPAAIRRLNGLRPPVTLRVGQVLRIPAAG